MVRDPQGGLKARYLYANGKPLRVDLLNVFRLDPWYHRYNARGDAMFVPKDGNGATGWRQFGAWGDLTYDADLKGYYNWNAAWGYLRFPRYFNFDLNDVLDVGLYYAHGRWYNQDTGLFLSPNGAGNYFYADSDPLNLGWQPTGSANSLNTQSKNGRYIDTKLFGFIDREHLGGGGQLRKILPHLEDGIPYPQVFDLEQAVSLQNLPFGEGKSSVVSVKFTVPAAVPGNLRLGVALGIYEELERAFEQVKASILDHNETNYAIEDLPSDYVGFFIEAKRVECELKGGQNCSNVMNLDKFLEQLVPGVQVTSSDTVPPRCNLLKTRLAHVLDSKINDALAKCLNMKNLQFEPKIYNHDRERYENVPWPPELRIPAITGGFWTSGGTVITIHGLPVDIVLPFPHDELLPR